MSRHTLKAATGAYPSRGVILVCAIVLMLAAWPVAASPHRPQVDMFLPASTPFWDKVARFGKAAAEDNDIRLAVHFADASRLKLLAQLKRRFASPSPPDGAIFPNFLETAPSLIKACEAAGIPCITFNSELSPADQDLFGLPRQHYQYWIAQLVPDDAGSAYRLARLLLERATQKYGSGHPLHMAAVTGYAADAPSRVRMRALRTALQEFPHVRLLQVFHTDWSETDAQRRTTGLLNRHRNVRIIWSSSSRITSGILAAIDNNPAHDINELTINGYDLDAALLLRISAGDLVGTAGGHYTEGAWAVVIMADHLAGHSPQERVILTPQLLVTQNNVNQVTPLLAMLNTPDALHRIDFSRFARPETAYHFDLEPILEQLMTSAEPDPPVTMP
ncbi:MAG: ABC transporter substrate-binding protein [Marinobacter sp.]|uniref:ABC transporter substrate-binding protein n=1 Tax=Marinobacter sp. TaxID=50741 RepID=UPI00299E5CAC|nr:ABC transporter substrate-binding protein [Marinobacter sp.]MDX1757040.1 ABC transporter substrate-binding protein [Marinobacter sp.]